MSSFSVNFRVNQFVYPSISSYVSFGTHCISGVSAYMGEATQSTDWQYLQALSDVAGEIDINWDWYTRTPTEDYIAIEYD